MHFVTATTIVLLWLETQMKPFSLLEKTHSEIFTQGIHNHN